MFLMNDFDDTIQFSIFSYHILLYGSMIFHLNKSRVPFKEWFGPTIVENDPVVLEIKGERGEGGGILPSTNMFSI